MGAGNDSNPANSHLFPPESASSFRRPPFIAKPAHRANNARVGISIVIPAHNEERHLGRCLNSIARASQHTSSAVETIVVLNRCTDRTAEIARRHRCRTVSEDAKNLARIRNAGAAAARGTILVTIDADSWMHPRTLRDIERKLGSGRYVGGGTHVLPERLSLGILCSALAILPYLLRDGLSCGLFWCFRRDFEAIGGFDETFLTVEDLDFLRRLKQYGRLTKRRFGTLWRAPLVTSCRKFDHFGDWHLFRNRAFLQRAFNGHDRATADAYWYEAR